MLLLGGMTAMEQETNYPRCDFVPGDEIFFDGPVEKEKVCEFPSLWDYLSGELQFTALGRGSHHTIAQTLRGGMRKEPPSGIYKEMTRGE